MPPVLSLSNFYGAGPANVHIESTGPGLCAIHRSSWNRYSRKSACRIMHSPGPTPRGHACPDLRTKGDTDRGSPFPLQASIKAHAPCEENAHSRRRQRLVGALYNFGVEPGLPLPPPRRPGFSLAPTHRSYATVFIMYRTGSKMD